MVTTGGDYRVTFTYVPNVADGKQIKVSSLKIIVTKSYNFHPGGCFEG